MSMAWKDGQAIHLFDLPPEVCAGFLSQAKVIWADSATFI